MHPTGGDKSDMMCLLLFVGNAVATNVAHPLRAMMLRASWDDVQDGVQMLALIGSLVASIMVAIDHYKKIKWKKRQDKADKTKHDEPGK